MDANTNGLQQQPQSSPSTYRSTYDDVQLYMTINPFSKHFGGLNEGEELNQSRVLLREKRGKKREGRCCVHLSPSHRNQ